MRLEELLYEQLADACPYLDRSGRAADQAATIANEVPYIVRGRRIRIRVSVDLWYRNPPGEWKHWATVVSEGEE